MAPMTDRDRRKVCAAERLEITEFLEELLREKKEARWMSFMVLRTEEETAELNADIEKLTRWTRYLKKLPS